MSGLSITAELNDELNDLIQRFHNQLHDSQVPATYNNTWSYELGHTVAKSISVFFCLMPNEYNPGKHQKVALYTTG